MTPSARSELIRRLAAETGFARCGIAGAGRVNRADYVREWLADGHAGEMHYLARHAALREDPRRLLDGARSIIVVADLYRHDTDTTCSQPKHTMPPAPDNASSPGVEGGPARGRPHDRSGTAGRPVDPDGAARGRIARYAWGRDYHRVLRRKLHRLADALHEAMDEPFTSRVCVDTAPLIEREIAAAAGIGWIGKNTMVLCRDVGSFFFLGEIITTLELAPSAPATDHCGSCTRCLDACPTAAFPAPYRMDATRCIAYLTIEHRSDIPGDLQPLMGDWVFGCDVCQDVCPYNREAPEGAEPAYALQDRNPLPPAAPLDQLLAWTPEDYRAHLAGSAMKRASLDMLKRNARIALTNLGRPHEKQGATDHDA